MKEEMELQIGAPLLGLVEFCESYCVADCCGVDAFEITDERVGRWVRAQGVLHAQRAQEQLLSLINEVASRDVHVASERINANWTAQACVTWLEKWKAALDAAIKNIN